jgi:DNA polymerase
VRPCFRAEPGRVLCVADLASVEARGVAWCAGEPGLLTLFAEGGDAYLDLAARIFGRPIAREDEPERQVGKVAVLGCGYSMGAARFARYAADNGIDLAAAGVTAEDVVEGYRDAYPAIAGTKVSSNGRAWRRGGLWRDVEAAAIAAVTTGMPREAGRCLFRREADALVVRLPSGRRLYYRNARVERIVAAYCKALGIPERPKPTLVFDSPTAPGTATYGGKLVENIVQAICRDLLAAALVECERQDLSVVLHVHDEVVAEALLAQAEEALRRLVEILSTPPAWAAGFPVEVEGFVSERYLKGPAKGVPKLKARNGQVHALP